VTSIEDSVKRAADIIRQMLVFSRGMDGKHIAFCPQNLVGEVVQFVRMTFPKSITFSTHLAENLWNVTGDQTQLHQVLLNLCVNARDAMPDGGLLKLTVENCEVDETWDAMPSDAKAGRFVRFSITDTGTGIPPSIIEKIFDPFFTTKGVGQGTGLGLSTVVGIVRSHGGFVKVDSQMGEGSTFSVFLSATRQPTPLFQKETQVVFYQGDGELILVVDDEAPIRKMLENVLRKNGYDVLTAANGNDALTTYESQRNKIHLVLTDLSMPGMDGVALSRRLKEADPKLKIIASSGQVEKSHRSELADLGVHGFLTKPYRQDQLLTIIHQEICGVSKQ
jgi:CheY-like chemotaxis protein